MSALICGLLLGFMIGFTVALSPSWIVSVKIGVDGKPFVEWKKKQYHLVSNKEQQ